MCPVAADHIASFDGLDFSFMPGIEAKLTCREPYVSSA